MAYILRVVNVNNNKHKSSRKYTTFYAISKVPIPVSFNFWRNLSEVLQQLSDMSSNGGMGCTEDMQVEPATENMKPGDGVPERPTTHSSNITENGIQFVSYGML